MASRPQFVDLDMQSAVKVINSPDPVAAQDAATKAYVDNVVAGLSFKDEVYVASTANLALSGEQTIDGSLTAASRVLVKDQSTASQNGIYLSAAGSWTRTTDADSSTDLNNATVFVTNGTVNEGRTYTQTTKNPTVGSSSIVWARYAAGNTYVAGAGLTESPALTFNVVDSGTGSVTVAADSIAVNPGTAANTSLEVAGGSLRVASAGLGSGLSGGSGSAIIADNAITARWKTQVTHSSGTAISFTHNLGKASLDYLVGVFYTGTGGTPGLDISAGVNIVKTSNGVTVTFNGSQGANTIGITVVG